MKVRSHPHHVTLLACPTLISADRLLHGDKADLRVPNSADGSDAIRCGSERWLVLEREQSSVSAMETSLIVVSKEALSSELD